MSQQKDSLLFKKKENVNTWIDSWQVGNYMTFWTPRGLDLFGMISYIIRQKKSVEICYSESLYYC